MRVSGSEWMNEFITTLELINQSWTRKVIFKVESTQNYEKICNSAKKTKWIWIYGREKRRYSAIKDYKMPKKAIQCHTMPCKAILGHTSHKAMLILMRPQIVMAVKSSIKATRGHIRPYKANVAIQYHNVPEKHIFCSLAHFLFNFEHF